MAEFAGVITSEQPTIPAMSGLCLSINPVTLAFPIFDLSQVPYCRMSFDHKPRILFLYGSLRERSYSRLLAEEAARIIED
ncbi:MAG: hypothetical protein AAFX01_14505, partial [Cyanobacteria bacterium J06638_28]